MLEDERHGYIESIERIRIDKETSYTKKENKTYFRRSLKLNYRLVEKIQNEIPGATRTDLWFDLICRYPTPWKH